MDPLSPPPPTAPPPSDQVLRRKGATSKSDVYSFGMVVWECLSRRVPWEGVKDVGVLTTSVKQGLRPDVPEEAPQDLVALVEACWAGDPAARPSLESVLAGLDPLPSSES